ncbi:hypothetical protein [Streptomyces sp. NPDC090112]|uniref:hypothetical protein n=1 Tax=Streptomyces sp. NPDC090112 TaxID=3365949 RepID=UPI0038108978
MLGVEERAVGEGDAAEVHGDGSFGGVDGFGQDVDGVEVEFAADPDAGVAGRPVGFGFRLNVVGLERCCRVLGRAGAAAPRPGGMPGV